MMIDDGINYTVLLECRRGGEKMHDEKQQAKSKKIMHVFFWFGLLVVVDNKQ